MSTIQTTNYGNSVVMNTAKAINTEGGGSIEAQIMSVMALGYDTNVQIMKGKVQEYRAKLNEQQKLNKALADIEAYKAGYSNAESTTKRTNRVRNVHV